MRILIVFFFCSISFFMGSAQEVPVQNYWQLKLEREMEEMRRQDSIVHAKDSLQMLWVKSPSLDRPNQFIDSLKAVYTVENGDIIAWITNSRRMVMLYTSEYPKCIEIFGFCLV